VRYDIEFRSEGGADVEIRLSGVASPAELSDLADALETDPRFRPGLAMLVDVSELESGTVTDAHLAELSKRIVARDWQSPPLAVAIVAPTGDVQKGARTYRAHVGGSRSSRHVVTSRREGLAWLEERRRLSKT
jgi:hypothetical protein